jgi:hypothetical protein
MDTAGISAHLETMTLDALAASRGRELGCARGVRGVPDGELARYAAALWRRAPARLPDHEDALTTLFGAAWEDGMLAIGMLAALVPDHAADAGEIGREWLPRIDDVATADALGWLVLGPAALALDPASPDIEPVLAAARDLPRAAGRRAAVSAGLAFTGLRAEGPAAAALRERTGQRHLVFVEAALDAPLARIADTFVRDEAPEVRKALRRLLRAWTDASPGPVVDWAEQVRGGIPRMLGEEVDRARRRAKRPARQDPEDEA